MLANKLADYWANGVFEERAPCADFAMHRENFAVIGWTGVGYRKGQGLF